MNTLYDYRVKMARLPSHSLELMMKLNVLEAKTYFKSQCAIERVNDIMHKNVIIKQILKKR